MISLRMTELNMEERISIRESARCLKKYGSTSSNSSTRQEHYIRHQVSSTDTLQGLALKYAVTTEQIRRANKLWQNDSLFLRSSLLIPVDCESASSTSDSVSSPSDITLEDSHLTTGSSSSVSQTDPDAAPESFNDFLVKIDCSIASTKSQVIISQDNSQFTGEWSPRKDEREYERHSGSGRQERTKRSYDHQPLCNGSDLPTVAVTRDRRLRHSLQRLHESEDSIFEL